jgi:hypothetical protein
MRHVLSLIVATAMLRSWTEGAAAAIWPEHNYSVRIGHRRFGVIDWSDDSTKVFKDVQQVESPLRADDEDFEQGSAEVTAGFAVSVEIESCK